MAIPHSELQKINPNSIIELFELELVEGLHYAREYGVRNKKEVFRPVAEIPEAVVDDMMRSGRFFDPNELKKWANDPHNKKLRYTNGRY